MTNRPATLAAVNRALAPDGVGQRAVAIRQLVGGTHATTWLVAIDGSESECVLRESPAGDPSVAWEATVLLGLDGLEGIAPRLLAEGANDAIPWLLLSKLPGVADITSGRPETIAEPLGLSLARVHHVGTGSLTPFRKVNEMTGGGFEAPWGRTATSVGQLAAHSR